MFKFKGKLTAHELLMVFAICSFPVHLWTIVNVFYDIPAWMKYMDLWDLAGAISYALAFALLEAIALFLPLVLAAWILPKKWLRGNFVPLSFAFVLEAVVMALVIHENERLLWDKGLLLKIFIGFYVLLAALIYLIPRIKTIVDAIGERILVLFYLYFALDVLALIAILVRNI
ncbi:MAG: hypothetical protein PVF83_17835 [Anaerolineales bacterium]|jgi:hypothetical protein